MPKSFPKKYITRIIDANINRSKEGLRVCEEIVRFVLHNQKLTADFKCLRHRFDSITTALVITRLELLKYRNSSTDCGRSIHAQEFKRKDISDIFFANMQRVKESVRVLEEFTKLLDSRSALTFKRLRYDIYEIEKRVARSIAAVRYRR